jgi:shikimate dehydrogenase
MVREKPIPTSKVGLIGYPLEHSISPQMQQVAFDHYGFTASYELWETPQAGLPARVAALRQPTYLGANVTIPYKQDVIPMLDLVSAEASAVGAVNVIVNDAGSLSGHNTDSPGFLMALEADGNFDPRGCSALVLGAGGAARAVSFALTLGGAGAITIANRDLGKANALASDLREYAGDHLAVASISWSELPASPALSGCELLVNATSVGLVPGQTPLPPDLIPRQALVFDLVYGQSRLVREAKGLGIRAIDGFSMLVYQGALSFELWTGQKAPVELMREAARQALASRATPKG